MKNVILAALLLLSLAATAQDRTLDTDSVGALTNAGGVFFQTRFLKYSNGEAESYTTRIGDTATVRNFLTNQVLETANPFTAAALVVLNRQKDVNKMRDIATAMQAAIGVDVYRDIRALYFREFVDTALVDKAWTWRDAATNTNLQIRYMASGNIRISGLPGISGATRNVDIFGPGWIRIVNYPTGSNTNLYRLRRGRWFTLGRETEMRMNGVNLNSN
jgi:hypothetical protein